MSVNLELQSVWISYPFLSKIEQFESHNFMFDAKLALSNSFIECYSTDPHLQISSSVILLKTFALDPQHVTMEDSYLCGYLKIKGLTEVRQTRGQCDRIVVM